jgi:hypothetical protein
MSSLGEDLSDMHRSLGSQAIKSVLDDTDEVWVNARHLADPGRQILELFEAGDVPGIEL